MSIRNKGSFFVLLFLATAICLGCGYRFSPGGEHIDQSIQTVFVENFVNATSEANIENYFRSAFIDQFRRGSRFSLAENKETADAFVTGSIKSSDVTHVSYSSADVAKEDRVNVTMEVAFKANKTNEIIWINNNFSDKKAFSVASSPSTTNTNRRNALKELAEDMAEKAYRSMMSGF